MMHLSREVRFALTSNYQNDVTNSWSAWPATNQVVPQLRLQCVVAGVVNAQTGYICNIKEIDHALREIITGTIIPQFENGSTAEQLLRTIYDCSISNWHAHTTIVRQTLFLNSFLSYSINAQEDQMTELTQQFEFSASHRLNCDELSAEENRAIFGKCNHPSGHGHNYVVEVTVAGELDHSGQLIPLQQFESTVKELVIDRLDHKHLNQDIECFANLNPSVENITTTIWGWLNGKFGDAQLKSVKVYETAKTWAQYSG